MQQRINAAALMQKEMDRKDFLKHVGIAAVALTGISAILRVLSEQPTSVAPSSTSRRSFGYGSLPYGGPRP